MRDFLRCVTVLGFLVAMNSSSVGQTATQSKIMPEVKPPEDPPLSVEDSLKVGRARACNAFLSQVCDPKTDRHCLAGITVGNLPDVCVNLGK
jgi:hypothetical protein